LLSQAQRSTVESVAVAMRASKSLAKHTAIEVRNGYIERKREIIIYICVCVYIYISGYRLTLYRVNPNPNPPSASAGGLPGAAASAAATASATAVCTSGSERSLYIYIYVSNTYTYTGELCRAEPNTPNHINERSVHQRLTGNGVLSPSAGGLGDAASAAATASATADCASGSDRSLHNIHIEHIFGRAVGISRRISRTQNRTNERSFYTNGVLSPSAGGLGDAASAAATALATADCASGSERSLYKIYRTHIYARAVGLTPNTKSHQRKIFLHQRGPQPAPLGGGHRLCCGHSLGDDRLRQRQRAQLRVPQPGTQPEEQRQREQYREEL